MTHFILPITEQGKIYTHIHTHLKSHAVAHMISLRKVTLGRGVFNLQIVSKLVSVDHQLVKSEKGTSESASPVLHGL